MEKNILWSSWHIDMKKYHTANQLNKRCKKISFQRIHDRFIRSPEFRNRMIEKIKPKNFVDDGMLLRMKITLTILTTQECSLYESKWWLHSKKQSSDTIRLTQRPWMTGVTCWLQYLERLSWTNLSWIQLCNRWIVYSWQLSTVTDGGCKSTTPQMTCFRGAKVWSKGIYRKQ